MAEYGIRAGRSPLLGTVNEPSSRSGAALESAIRGARSTENVEPTIFARGRAVLRDQPDPMIAFQAQEFERKVQLANLEAGQERLGFERDRFFAEKFDKSAERYRALIERNPDMDLEPIVSEYVADAKKAGINVTAEGTRQMFSNLKISQQALREYHKLKSEGLSTEDAMKGVSESFPGLGSLTAIAQLPTVQQHLATREASVEELRDFAGLFPTDSLPGKKSFDNMTPAEKSELKGKLNLWKLNKDRDTGSELLAQWGATGAKAALEAEEARKRRVAAAGKAPREQTVESRILDAAIEEAKEAKHTGNKANVVGARIFRYDQAVKSGEIFFDEAERNKILVGAALPAATSWDDVKRQLPGKEKEIDAVKATGEFTPVEVLKRFRGQAGVAPLTDTQKWDALTGIIGQKKVDEFKSIGLTADEASTYRNSSMSTSSLLELVKQKRQENIPEKIKYGKHGGYTVKP